MRPLTDEEYRAGMAEFSPAPKVIYFDPIIPPAPGDAARGITHPL